jgi:hypothetical protein
MQPRSRCDLAPANHRMTFDITTAMREPTSIARRARPADHHIDVVACQCRSDRSGNIERDRAPRCRRGNRVQVDTDAGSHVGEFALTELVTTRVDARPEDRYDGMGDSGDGDVDHPGREAAPTGMTRHRHSVAVEQHHRCAIGCPDRNGSRDTTLDRRLAHQYVATPCT